MVGESIGGEHIGQGDLGLQAKLHVVSEQELIADRDQVSWDAVVFGGHAFGRDENRFDVAKDFRSGFVQPRKS